MITIQHNRIKNEKNCYMKTHLTSSYRSRSFLPFNPSNHIYSWCWWFTDLEYTNNKEWLVHAINVISKPKSKGFAISEIIFVNCLKFWQLVTPSKLNQNLFWQRYRTAPWAKFDAEISEKQRKRTPTLLVYEIGCTGDWRYWFALLHRKWWISVSFDPNLTR